jgi:protein gp37
MSTKIQWTEETWNPVAGCRRKSPGCLNCYAERQALRLACNPNEKIQSLYSGLTQITNGRPAWTGATGSSETALLKPLRTKKPTTYFISLSDLFYDERPLRDIYRVLAVIALSGQHRFQVLTKYADTMSLVMNAIAKNIKPLEEAAREIGYTFNHEGIPLLRWPIPNLHLGVSVENQQYADERIPLLLKTPAALRFVSYEPALGPVNFSGFLPRRVHDSYHGEWNRVGGLDWIIVGGESGPGARPFNVDWAWTAIKQCRAAGTKVFLKQLGSNPVIEGCRQHHFDWGEGIGRKAKFSQVQPERENAGLWRIHLKDKKGGDMAEWAEHLRVREMPEVRP